MKNQDKLGIISAIITVLAVLWYIFIFIYPPDDLQPYILHFQLVLAVGIPWFFWYITTHLGKQNEKYVRGKIAEKYVECHTIATNLLGNPRGRGVELLDQIKELHVEAIHLMEVHAYLLHADEIEKFRDDWEVIESRLADPLRGDLDNVYKLDMLARALEEQMKKYIKTHEISEYYEYLH